MNYSQTLRYLLQFTDAHLTPSALFAPGSYDLRRVFALLERLGNPHRGAITVHIAGTKGKGSTGAMIASALAACGYRTGLYTSPHLHSFRERIQVDGRPIAEEDWVALVEFLEPLIDEMHADPAYGRLTTYELLTVMAFQYFERRGASVRVLETGLGGRLDATNVVPDTRVCVITSLSLDHTAILGSTLAAIAKEKAGIIKPGAVVVSAPQAEAARQVIRVAAEERGARLVQVGEDVQWTAGPWDVSGQNFDVRLGGGQLVHLRIPLLGEHQLENAAVALAALDALRQLGVPINEDKAAEGMAQVAWPGRLETLQEQPLLVVDGAHNPYSCNRLTAALQRHFPGRPVTLLLGISGDKDVEGMVREFLPLAPQVVATRVPHPRAAAPERIARACAAAGISATVVEPPAAALDAARRLAGEAGLICATGSLFMVAAIREAVLGIRPDLDPATLPAMPI